MYGKGPVTSFQNICGGNFFIVDTEFDGFQGLQEIHWTNSLIVIHFCYCHAQH